MGYSSLVVQDFVQLQALRVGKDTTPTWRSRGTAVSWIWESLNLPFNKIYKNLICRVSYPSDKGTFINSIFNITDTPMLQLYQKVILITKQARKILHTSPISKRCRGPSKALETKLLAESVMILATWLDQWSVSSGPRIPEHQGTPGSEHESGVIAHLTSKLYIKGRVEVVACSKHFVLVRSATGLMPTLSTYLWCPVTIWRF